jgi:hypothetical protein
MLAAGETAQSILVIGEVEERPGLRCITWADVPDSVPSTFQYSTILVIPGPDSAELQESLRDLLRSELKGRPSGGSRVLWVLNAHSIDSVATDFNLGTLVPLRDLDTGSVRSLIPGLCVAQDQLHYGIDGLSVKAVELGYWERNDRRSHIPLAASSSDRRWFLVPPAESYEWIEVRSTLGPSPIFSALAVFILLLGIVWLGAISALNSQEEYASSVRELGNVRLLPIPPADIELDERWINPDAHMASRVLEENRDELARIVSQLDPALTPYELWKKSNFQEESAFRYYYLSVLVGDLVSAYRIVREYPAQSWYKARLRRALTQTMWQTSVEYLYELNLEEARFRNEAYLAGSQHLLKKAEGQSELTPQRIRTLSYILHREFETGRIRSLCNDPDVVPVSFARLHSGYWASPLPSNTLPGLTTRRGLNKTKSCENGVPEKIADYRLLQNLRSSSQHSPELCSLFPLECDFVKLRDLLFNYPQTLITPKHAARTLEFASDCSYLSDDALWMMLAASFGQQRYGAARQYHFVPGSVEAVGLWPVLQCAENLQGDMNTMLGQAFDEMPCGLLNLSAAAQTGAPREIALVEKVLAKCEP